MRNLSLPLLLLLPLSVDAFAAQTVAAVDGQTVAVRVSRNDLTRIRVENGRIDRVWGTKASMEVQTDSDSGQVFVRALTHDPFSLFVKTDKGETYTLLATPMDVPAETLIIRPSAPEGARPSAAGDADAPFVERVKRLVRAMAEGESRYRRVAVGTEVPVWRESRIVLVARWPGDLLGEEYRLTNVSTAPMRLDEREFAALAENITAVAIEEHELAPGQSTRVLLVRRNRDGRD